VSEISVPPFIRLLASPVGAAVVRLPMGRGRVRAMLRQAGHGASLEAGRIPASFVDWRMTLHRDTDSMRSERDMVRAVVRGWAFRPGFTFEDAALARVRQPALLVYGTADPVGTAGTWRRVVGLMPRAEVHLVEGGGHVPWLDDPTQVAGAVGGFLAGSHSTPPTVREQAAHCRPAPAALRSRRAGV
jgi:2-hydroxy-6-oxonona-2,4-dienedioate hydrolase